MTAVVIEYFKMILMALLGLQWGSVLLFLFLEWAMVDYYRFGTFQKPTNIFDKTLNIIMAIAMGSGYFLYSKFEKHNWIARKIFMLISLVIHCILCIIVYFIITIPIDLIFIIVIN